MSSSSNDPLMITVEADGNGRAKAELTLTEEEAKKAIFSRASQGWKKKEKDMEAGLTVELISETKKTGLAETSSFSYGRLRKTSDGYVLQFQQLIDKRGVGVGDVVCFKYKGVASFYYVLNKAGR